MQLTAVYPTNFEQSTINNQQSTVNEGTAVLAYTTIRQKDVQAHRRWMIRNFALTFAAVTLRLWLPILPVLLGGFEPGYQAVSFMVWVPNVLVAEWMVRRKKRWGVNGHVEQVAAQA